MREPHQQKAERSSDKAYKQHGPSAYSVGNFSEDGRKDELHRGIGGEHQADHSFRSVVSLRVKRQDGNDYAKAYEVNEDSYEDYYKW